MDHYQRGYLDGYRAAKTGVDTGRSEAERLDFAEGMGQPAPSIDDQGEYWIGYYHGRSHAETGAPPATAVAAGRVPAGL